ncbi:hypothetical protein BDN72DRAFT_289609 [Pluteus cervinus]|uniref:Uncharacterized protein n=1 Tax=Pluteus cervinus TaxID=181527 RepID=A0ACD3AEH9_9AGAR|nr:hypothetical protein BDN72DRAFT_289609 [Pluteus cervinus]
MLSDVLHKLPISGYSQTHNDVSRKTDKNTGQWFLNAKPFQDWKDSTGQKIQAILSLGDPGVGKTCMVSLVIDHLQKLGAPTQFQHFFTRFSQLIQVFHNMHLGFITNLSWIKHPNWKC